MELIYLILPIAAIVSLCLSESVLHYEEDRLERPMNRLLMIPRFSVAQKLCLSSIESLILLRHDLRCFIKIFYIVCVAVLLFLLTAVTRFGFRTYEYPGMSFLWIVSFAVLFFVFFTTFRNYMRKVWYILHEHFDSERERERYARLYWTYWLICHAHLILSVSLLVYGLLVFNHFVKCI